MKKFYTLLVILTLSFGFFPVKTSSANECATTNQVPFCEDYIYVRICVSNTCWIFVYTQEGSFITVYVDEDE